MHKKFKCSTSKHILRVSLMIKGLRYRHCEQHCFLRSEPVAVNLQQSQLLSSLFVHHNIANLIYIKTLSCTKKNVTIIK